MHLIKEKLDIEESLEKKIKSILKFLNIKSELKNGNIVHIKNTNLAYVEPHTLRINNTLFLFFNETERVYINNLSKCIPLSHLKDYIKNIDKQKINRYNN